MTAASAKIYKLPSRYPLSVQQQRVAHLRALGLQHKEIARMLGLGLGTVKQHALMARARLGPEGWIRFSAEVLAKEVKQLDKQ